MRNGGDGRRRQSPRGGDLTGEGQNGAPVHGLAWDLAQMFENGMYDPPMCSGRGIGARDGVRGGGAGLCGGARQRARCVGLGSEFWRVCGRAQSQRQTQAGSVRGCAGLATAAHGVRGGGASACCVRDPRVRHGLQELAQNKEGVEV